jgi:hypothetical protein
VPYEVLAQRWRDFHIVSGWLLWRSSLDAAFRALLVIVLVLAVVSLRNSWDLLVSVGAATLNDERDHVG